MQICKDCSIPMVGIMSFSKDKHERFYRCSKCCRETKHQRIKEDELAFGEVLHSIAYKNSR